MKNKRFWKLEYTITLLVVFAVVALMLPTSIHSTLQADLIRKWSYWLNNLSYMKDVMTKHEQENMLAQLKRAQTKDERERIISLIIKPYFRLTENKYLKHYHPKYMAGTRVKDNDPYNFTELYNGKNSIIVGIKDIKEDKTDSAMFMMMFDVNGILPPNTWGKDIFGAKVFNDRVEAIGKDLPVEIMKNDCSKKGTGISCSYYYTIGGSFEE